MARSKSRKQRHAKRRVEQQAAQRRRRILLLSAGVLVLIAIVGIVVGRRVLRGPLPGEAVPGMGNYHLQDLAELHAPYNSSPPTSGGSGYMLTGRQCKL